MLGSCFLKHLSGDKDFEMYAHDRDNLDLLDSEALNAVFAKVSPDFVINCAAYTAVDDCESNNDAAIELNGSAAGEIAKVCKRENATLLHFSTDYVFDGESKNGYKEDDAPSPINVYGESKLLGEKLIQENMDDYYIIRTSWLFGENGDNFVSTMLKLAKDRDHLDVVGDQIGSPTYTQDLTMACIKRFLTPFLENVDDHHSRFFDADSNVFEKLDFGIYHLTNSESVSWFGFAEKIFELANANISITEITSDEFLRPAARPKCSILKSTKSDFSMRSWEDALKSYLRLILQ